MRPPDTQIRDTLRATAEELVCRYQKLPIPIGRISFELGISIQRTDLGKNGGSYLVLPREKGVAPKVLLPKNGNFDKPAGDESLDRFKVAHELGHYFVHRYFGFLPEGRSEYWVHEAICDDFARHLLLPERVIVRRGYFSLGALLSVDALSGEAGTPWFQTATRVTEVAIGTSILTLDFSDGAFVRVTNSSLPNKREIRRKIARSSKFIKVILDLSRRTDSCKGAISGEVLSDAGFTSFSDNLDYCIEVRPGSYLDYFTVAIRETGANGLNPPSSAPG